MKLPQGSSPRPTRTRGLAAFFILMMLLPVTGRPAGLLDELRARYGGLRTIHFKSRAQVRLYPTSASSKAASGELRLEYWADDNRYRISCHADTSLGLAPDIDIAWNGSLWQFYQPDVGILHQRRTEPDTIQMACLNPLFLPLDYLSAGDTSSCPGCSLKFLDLRDPAAWDVTASPLPASAARGLSATDEVFLQPKQAPHRSYRLVFRSESGLALPAQLTRFYPTGRKALDVGLGRSPNSTTNSEWLPTRLAITAFDDEPENRVMMTGVWTLDLLEIDGAVPDDRFGFDLEDVSKVWDSDAHVFIKHPDDRVRARTLMPPTAPPR